MPIAAARTNRPEVGTSGTGEVRIKPDLVHVTVQFVSIGKSAMDAGQENAATMTQILAAVRRQGIPDSAVTTVGYNVQRREIPPRPNEAAVRSEPVIEYAAVNSIRVTLRQIDRLGSLIDTALASGANTVQDISFASTRQRELRLEALGLAVANARAEAEAMATAAGGTLGELIELSEGVGSAFYAAGGLAQMSRLSRSVISTPLSPQDVTVAAQVRIRWVFRPGPR